MTTSTYSVVSPKITKSFPKPKTTCKSLKSMPVCPLISSSTTKDVNLQRTIQASQTNKPICMSKLDHNILEAKAAPLKFAIIGFGRFGQFIAEGLQRQGHEVLATSRSDYSEYCKKNGITFYKSIDEMFKLEQPDIVMICCSIISFETVVRSIPLHDLKEDTIIVDVLSVKSFPKKLLLQVLPFECGIVCTHPMFGPESGKNGWAGLPFVYEKVRISQGEQAAKCSQFLGVLKQEGCRMVEMPCEEHDRQAASSQFITHTVGRVLSHLNLKSTTINTKGYETLLQLTENTINDSFDLYYGIFMYNINAIEQLDNLERAFATVKHHLFNRLEDLLGKQIAERNPVEDAANELTEVESAAKL